MIDGKRKKVLDMAWTLAVYYSAKYYAVCREVGLPIHVKDKGFWTKQRADFIAVNKNQEVVIVETKSCWSDFSSDKKWTGYLQHCNKFYFASDAETAERIAGHLKTVPEAKGVGVIAFERFEQGRDGLRMKFLVSARTHERKTQIVHILWQMAVRSSGFGPWSFPHGNIFEDPDEQETEAEDMEYRRKVLGKLDRFGYVTEAQRFLKWCNSHDIDDPFVLNDDKFDDIVKEWRLVSQN